MALELLSPAGSPEALRAAVQSGCGAVYLGWGSFNARRSAKNFSDEEFADAIRYCHLRGVRVFLTLNTLLTDRELPLALDAARTACRLGVDSVLVQDWGLFALLREALPDLPLHASTQMSVFTAGGANEVYGDGCERVVLARECRRHLQGLSRRDRDLRPWCSLHVLLWPVRNERPHWRTQRQPGHLRPALPPALRLQRLRQKHLPTQFEG